MFIGGLQFLTPVFSYGVQKFDLEGKPNGRPFCILAMVLVWRYG